MTTSPTQTHDARHANRRLLVEQIRNDGLDAVLARMTGEEFKEFKVFVVAALLGKLDNQSTSPNVEAPRAWNDVSSVQTEVARIEPGMVKAALIWGMHKGVVEAGGFERTEINGAFDLNTVADHLTAKLANVPSPLERRSEEP